jgi:serine/threonine protein kinase
MINVPGYTVLDLLSSSDSSTLYRGRTDQDKSPVVIKMPGTEPPSRSELAQIRWEYEIAKDLDLEGVVRPINLISFQQSCALIMEDIGGVPLNTVMAEHTIDLMSGLQIALRLAETLGKIHQKGIIHKDIKPSNIILSKETGQIKLTDFSIASRVSGEKQPYVNPDLLEGTLAYISPEQTGRMNRSIDHRADLYSLGVTMYEIFTGVLPFASSEKVELIHCHMAIPPKPPRECDKNIPELLSDIIMKLLAKNAEDRYRSSFGLRHDLEECVKQLKSTGDIRKFVLGKRDIPTTLQIPEKLYGRNKELAELMSAFMRAAQGRNEMMLVKGSPGIGKSVLINELHKPIVEQKGYFAAGKFDQFKHDVPYSALRQAFKELSRQLLSERTERIIDWQERIQNALGPNGQIIVELIPEMELIIGKQPPVETLPPTQSQNRFNMVFTEFVKIFARREHPLVIFLDDMQWADWATLKLVELLVTTPDLKFLLLIMAYRDNEVGPAHPLMLTLDEIAAAGITT